MRSVQDPALEGASVTLVLAGEIDLVNACEISAAAAAAIEARATHVVLDLQGVSFMDSEGLKAMLLARRDLLASGATVVLRRPSPRVSDVLTLAGLRDMFDII